MPARRPVNAKLLPLLVALAASATAAPDPDSIPAYKDGLDAMASNLWDFAATRFETALRTPDLDAAGRRTLLLRLAETRIRADQSEAALAILSSPALDGDPELPFWRAQAHAAAGQFGPALEFLDEKATAPGAPHRSEALFTRAALQQALGDPSGAGQALEILEKSEDPATVLRAKMEQAEIQLSQGKPDVALSKLPLFNDPNMSSQDKARSEVLRARAELGRGENAAAISLFTAVLEKTDDPAFRFYRPDAAAGLARAQLAAGNPGAATDGLLAFIQGERDAPRFGEIFTILLECLPKSPQVDDIILIRLREWCPIAPRAVAPNYIGGGSGTPLADSTNSAAEIWTLGPSKANELGTQALFHLALGLRRLEDTPDAKASARRLMLRVRTEYPEHPLANRALLETIRWDIEDNRRDQAMAALTALESSGALPPMRAGAALAVASSAFASKDYALANEELDKAAKLLEGDALRANTVNSAVTLLAAGNLRNFDKLVADRGKDPRISDDLALERALFLTAQKDPGALEALDAFIIAHPEHPRLPEARLAAAHAALNANPPDLRFAKALLEDIPADKLAGLPPADLALAKIGIACREKRLNDAVAIAETFLKDHPDAPGATAVSFELGNACWDNKDYNQALLTYAELAKKHPTDPQAPWAQFRAARAAALGGTSKSQEESLTLFDEVIAAKNDFSVAARLEKARVLTTLKRLDEVEAGLLPWFQSMKKDEPVRVTAGLLLGDALTAKAGSDVAKLQRTIDLYEELLASLPKTSERRFEIEYRRGLTIEHLPASPENSRKALEVYYSVLQAAAKSPPSDWQWVDKCGVRARNLLETQQDWKGAIGVAKKHAMLGSPGSKEAATRAAKLQQEHWEW
ncbi:tetratricopeptide repeat protein [Haloferula sp. BvORR071]|uniref:tetratricopeptide repeat protein n=1 Tax=Haloferula sp. BvORR071 TaxID=1396141 RepID=UPI000554B3FC|nr:tetratricopeptide repeat protein [Haloferula sp. BvORR071]